MTLLKVKLLGEFSLIWCETEGEKPLTTITSPRLQSLLAYLVLHRDAPQVRQHLAFCLWPDLREERARPNLRKLYYQLHQALPQADLFLRADAQTIQWRADGPFSLDLATFERAASNPDSVAAWQQAIDVYSGDLLPSCYDDWVMPERERLRQMLLETMERLLQWAEAKRDYQAAIGYAQRLLQRDPLREDIHRRLISLHALNDDRAMALRAYHTCASILQRELGVEPGLATRQVYERLLDVELAAPALTASFPLVGRNQEWAQLLAIWRKASAGHPQLALLTGEGGIGKTRLAEELLAWASRQNINTAIARCYPAEGALAYAPVTAWLRARPLPKLERVWLTEVARLLPELFSQWPDLPAPGPLTEAWQRQRLHESLARAVLGGRLLLLVLEDLQWCDQDTLEWLHYLLRFDSSARVLILGTLRQEEIAQDHPVATLLAALRRNWQLTEIVVGPLDAEATAQLATKVCKRELTAERATWLYNETEGNPLFIVEAMRAGSADADTTSMLLTMQTVLGARLAQLSPPAHELIELAAAVGREFTFDVLRQASGADEESLVRGLDELWQRRIVREIGVNAYDFTHGKLREVAFAGLSAARKRLLHRRVAEALEATYADDLESVSASVAAHYEQAHMPGQAVLHYRRAAEAARRVYANDSAIALFSRALDLTEANDLAQRYELLRAREQVYDVRGMRELQLGDIADLQALAQALKDEQRQAEVWLLQAQYAEETSDYVAAIAAAQTAVRLAQDARTLAISYLQWARALWQHGDYDSAREQLERALELAQAANAPDVQADSLHDLSAVAEYQGNHIGARDYAGRALSLYRKLGDRRGEFRALNNICIASICLGDRADAQSSFEQVLRFCRDIGHRRGESVALRNLGGLAAYRGDYATAQACYEQSLQLCRATGDQRGESETLAYLGLLFRHLGNHPAACDHSQRAAHIAQQVGAKYELGLALTHLGHALLELGQAGQAADAYRQALTLRRALGDLDLVMEPLAGLALVFLTLGDLAQAQAHTEEILSYLAHATLDGADEPFRVYLACYRVLQAAGDPRAIDVLKTAYNLLQAQAAQIPDPKARRVFLEDVAVHREINRAWHAVEQIPGRN